MRLRLGLEKLDERNRRKKEGREREREIEKERRREELGGGKRKVF